MLFFSRLEAEIILLDYREEYSLLLHLDRLYCILQIFNMQTYARKKSQPLLRSYYIMKNAKIFSGKYNLNLKEMSLIFWFLNKNIALSAIVNLFSCLFILIRYWRVYWRGLFQLHRPSPALCKHSRLVQVWVWKGFATDRRKMSRLVMCDEEKCQYTVVGLVRMLELSSVRLCSLKQYFNRLL